MRDEDKAKEQLISELAELRRRNAKLEASETRHKQAEQALRRSEQRFRELADLLPQNVFETDLEGNITFVNRGALNSTGYTREDFDEGMNASQMVVPEERAKIEENLRKTLSGEKLGGTEYTVLRKDGSTFLAIGYTTPTIYEGKPVGLRGISVDITERRQIEEELRESEDRFRSFYEVAGERLGEQLPLWTHTIQSQTNGRRKQICQQQEAIPPPVWWMAKSMLLAAVGRLDFPPWKNMIQ